MYYLISFIVSLLVLFINYRTALLKGIVFSLGAIIFLLIKYYGVFPYETLGFVLFLGIVPFVVRSFKNKLDGHKESMRIRFDAVKKEHESLMRHDRHEVESNLEKEKRLQQVLSLYEISKDMSTCLFLEDIFRIFSMTLKRSFRFKSVRFVVLRDSKYIESVYKIELGQGIAKVVLDDFDVELMNLAVETKKMICIFPGERVRFSRRLSMVKDFESLISIPLFIESNISALLYVENMPRVYLDNFVILVAQFAIQFQKVMLYKKVQEMSITDSLTEISTRRYFMERFLGEIKRSMRHKSHLSFLMLDIDHFKEKNDKFGHLVGDVVLKKVASVLRANLREIDIIGRYGGEEFAIALAGIDREGAFQVAERIRESIEGEVFEAYDESVSATVSIGVSVFPEDGVDPNSLIEHADKALYKAKESGRNKVC